MTLTVAGRTEVETMSSCAGLCHDLINKMPRSCHVLFEQLAVKFVDEFSCEG